MVTGDYGLTAESIARRIGIIREAQPRIVTGAELDSMDEAALRDALMGEVIFAHVAPEHKLCQYQKKFATCIFTSNTPEAVPFVLFAFSGGRIPIALNVMHILSVDLGTDEEMSPGDMMTLLKLRRGRYSLVEEKIAADSSVVGRTIADLDLPEECVIAAIIRRGHLILPHGDTMLQTGDNVLALTSTERLQRLAEILGKSA